MKNFIRMNIINILTATLIYLKVADYIDWSWWVVLMPLYLPYFIAILVLVVWLYYEVKKIKRMVAKLIHTVAGLKDADKKNNK